MRSLSRCERPGVRPAHGEAETGVSGVSSGTVGEVSEVAEVVGGAGVAEVLALRAGEAPDMAESVDEPAPDHTSEDKYVGGGHAGGSGVAEGFGGIVSPDSRSSHQWW